MKISSKGRYALACMICMEQLAPRGEYVTVAALSQKLNLSKIYLEQVFALLKRNKLVDSTKGAQGGYRLSKPASEITVYNILAATEAALFDEADATVKDTALGIEGVMRDMVFRPASDSLKQVFERMRLSDLAEEAQKRTANESFMYYL